MVRPGDTLELVDEHVYRAALRERYKTGQALKVRRYLRQLCNAIADYVEAQNSVETKKQYARISRNVRGITRDWYRQILRIVKNDLRRLYRAEVEWIRETYPDMIDGIPDETRTVNKVLFGAFNGRDTIGGYFQELANRIHGLWDGQLRVATMTDGNLKAVSERVLGRNRAWETGLIAPIIRYAVGL